MDSELRKYWRMPPIIGEVTEDSIVVVLRTTYPMILRLRVYEQAIRNDFLCLVSDHSVNEDVTQIVIDKPISSCASCFCFSWSMLGTKYEDTKTNIYETDGEPRIGNEKCIYTHFVPQSSDPDKIYLVSCDLPEADLKHSHWQTLYKDLDFYKSNLLLHIGDQVYCDREFHRGKKRLQQDKYPNDLVLESVCEEYRQRYETTYQGHYSTLSSVSNLCILDDHEVVNDSWDLDEGDKYGQLVKRAAMKVYGEYQQQLHADPLSGNSWYRISKDLLVVTVDREVAMGNLDGVFMKINALCYEDPSLALGAKLVLCFTSAPIPAPTGVAGRLYKRLCGEGKFWTKEKLSNLYSKIMFWLNEDRHRSAFLCGGDIHFGVRGSVRSVKYPALRIDVIVTSGITNYQTLDRRLAAKGYSSPIRIDKDLKFHPLEAKAKRNFASIDMSTQKVEMFWSKKRSPASSLCYRRHLLKMGGIGCGKTKILKMDSSEDSD